ncbi:unnamed protein product [Trichogramma brassicae]|uniref:STAS domain-containing protein n=1 Tax=Trichogramma brassicae TaxID=86971 RepID=A0A6H5ITH6_9HYME|nr:unnamed protein product [Trichogramma brassicae]
MRTAEKSRVVVVTVQYYKLCTTGEMRMRSPINSRVKSLVRRRLPIVAWLPEYSWGKLLQDALAGMTVGLTAIPQGIAYAVVARLEPQYGLYSSFMGCFVYIIFGSVKDVTVGPTAIMGLLTQPYVGQYGADFAVRISNIHHRRLIKRSLKIAQKSVYFSLQVLLCFLSGCIMALMGLFRVGFLVDFISMPVIAGFTNAAAVIIGSSQIGTLLGITGRAESFVDAMRKLFERFDEIQLGDTLLGVFSMILLVGLKNLPGNRRGSAGRKLMWIMTLSRNAVVVVLGMLLAYLLSLYGLSPFEITGDIAAGLPSLTPPPFSTAHNNVTYGFVDMVRIYGTSMASVPLIAVLESIAIAKSFAKGKTVNANQEMLAVGLCNVFGSFVRSMPTTGSFTRTAVNNASGVRTPMGGLVTGILVLLACGLLTGTFRFIPKATLAAVIIIAMYYMLEIKLFRLLWRTKKIDLIPLIVTLITCLAFGLDYGMIIGIASNLLSLLYYAARPEVIFEERTENGASILLVMPQQSLSFPAAEYLRERVMNWCDSMQNTKIVVIDGKNVRGIDTTVAKNLSLLSTDLEARKQRLVFWNWCENASSVLISFDSANKEHFKRTNALAQVVGEYI